MFVVGDFNARKAREDEYRIGKFGIGDRNENGNRLMTGSTIPWKLVITEIMKMGVPNGATHAEIDHIMSDRSWCLLDTSVVSSLCTGSDNLLPKSGSIIK